MRRGVGSFYFVAALACAFASASSGCHREPPPEIASRRAAEAQAPLDGKTQLVTVVSDEWTQFRATLRRFERTPGGPWKEVGNSIDVVLGREGYGWGRGLHGGGIPEGRPGPIKREGDGRSPAGVFEIGHAYGYAPTRTDLSLPYTQATPTLRCIDDPRSTHYNQIVSTADTEVDWNSAEQMLREDDLYVLAIVIEHNTSDPKPARGSCIFVHLWDGPDRGMSGCTALPLPALEDLAAWLSPGAAAWVALPRSEYEALKRPWGLPIAADLPRPLRQKRED